MEALEPQEVQGNEASQDHLVRLARMEYLEHLVRIRKKTYLEHHWY